MAGFWSRGDELSALEERLRAGRPQPGVELERAIGQRIGRRSRSGGRALLALALTAGVFGAMASFGGVGYAVSSVRSAVGPGHGNTPLAISTDPGRAPST
jgi:ferric-dicitrate binding protein FerR (iron transport regulator)